VSHTFDLRLAWDGDTGAPTWPRDLTATAEGKPSLSLSSAPGYGGDALRWNPEDTFGASLAACHTLTFLSLAAKYRLVVRRVDVAVTVTLATVDKVATNRAIGVSILVCIGEAHSLVGIGEKYATRPLHLQEKRLNRTIHPQQLFTGKQTLLV
jgi:organic hydroperoxide reductase OsmC/OhrA